jgi:hypothetical protein
VGSTRLAEGLPDEVEGITMKRIAFLTVVLGVAAGIGYATNPDETKLYLAYVAQGAVRLWENIEANPVPVIVAAGTFLLTVIYLHAKGKTLRESVTVAATRVSLVGVPKPEDENPVVKRAKARATRAQLLSDQVCLENRYRHLPEAVRAAEKETCYTEKAVADAEGALEKKQQAHESAVAKLEALRKEKATVDAELAAIEVELKKLNEVV